MGFELGYGPITVQGSPLDGRSRSLRWADSLASARLAEELGFGSVWVGEHHFTADGYLSAVFPILAALAQRTERVRLGTKVLLAPLHHPLRIAEDAAAVQSLSGGRLVLGAAVGYRPEEFAAFGVELSERGRRLDAMIDVCRAAWQGSPVPIGPGSDATVMLEAVPPPPIWLGGRAPAALRRVGRRADGYVAPVGAPDDLLDQVAVVDGHSRDAGREPLPIASSSFVVVRGPGTGGGEARESLDRLLAIYAGSKADDPASRVGSPARSAALVIDGTVEQIIRRLREFRDALGPEREHVHVVRLEHPGMSADHVRRQLTAFAEHVLPALVEGHR